MENFRCNIIYVVLVFSYGIIRCSSSQECPEGASPGDLARHDGRCCVVITCEPGHKPKICEDDKPATTVCISCPDGEFMGNYSESYQMKNCSVHEPCESPRKTTSGGGNTTHNYICECNVDGGYVDDPNKPGDCINVCPAGQQMDDSGMCEPCQEGYFKPAGQKSCINCSDCEQAGRSSSSRCNISHDSICSPAEMVTGDEMADSSETQMFFWFFILPAAVALLAFILILCYWIVKCCNELIIVILCCFFCVYCPTLGPHRRTTRTSETQIGNNNNIGNSARLDCESGLEEPLIETCDAELESISTKDTLCDPETSSPNDGTETATPINEAVSNQQNHSQLRMTLGEENQTRIVQQKHSSLYRVSCHDKLNKTRKKTNLREKFVGTMLKEKRQPEVHSDDPNYTDEQSGENSGMSRERKDERKRLSNADQNKVDQKTRSTVEIPSPTLNVNPDTTKKASANKKMMKY